MSGFLLEVRACCQGLFDRKSQLQLLTPVAFAGCSRESFESQTLWCTEESLEGAHVRWFTLLQGGEKAAAIVIGHHDAEIWPRFRSGDDEAGDVVECSQIAQQRVGWAFKRQRDSGCGGDVPINP